MDEVAAATFGTRGGACQPAGLVLPAAGVVLEVLSYATAVAGGGGAAEMSAAQGWLRPKTH